MVTAESYTSRNLYLENQIGMGSSLLAEINYFRRNFRRDGLPYNWLDLPGTGFMINKQVDLILKEKIDTGLLQTEQDIKGFILEYLAEGLVFPVHYKINSKEELIDANYGNKRVIDIVSSEERNGAVKETISKKIEPFLVNSPDGSIAVMASPAGWSGLRAENGQRITFMDSQTYIWQKKGNEILGFTIRTDFTNGEHKEMLRRLGIDLRVNASLIDYVLSPALIQGEDIRSIVDIVRDVRRDASGSNFAYKNRLWAEVYRDLERRDELWRFDEITQKMIMEFKDYVLAHKLSKDVIKEALAVTILRIAKFLRKSPNFTSEEIHPPSRYPYRHMEGVYMGYGYGAVLTEVQKLPGCAGGGNSGKTLVSSITPRFGDTSLLSEDEWFTCPKCGYKADSSVGDQCPSCGITKEAFAKESGAKICE